MRGTYQYAPMKVMLAKIVKDKDINPSSKTPDDDVIAFVDGDYIQYSHASIELPGLSAGEYMVFFAAEWAPLNLMRKLIFNIYAPDPLEVRRVPTDERLNTVMQQMYNWLNKRLNEGTSYKYPSFAL